MHQSPLEHSGKTAATSLLLLPGLACDAEVFAAQLPALQAWGARSGHPVQVSTAHARAATLPEMARLLLAEHPHGALRLAGCSMGGMLAIELHRQAPQRIEAIALLGTTARPDTPDLIELRTKACELFAAGRMDEVLGANIFFAFHPAHAQDRALTQRYLAMLRRAGAQQLIAQNHAVMARVDSRPHLPAIRCPVLVACGEADQLTPPEHAREMAALLPHSRLELVAGAGHMLTMEQPQRLTDLLLAWLDAADARRTGGARP